MGPFRSVTRTEQEVSVVCRDHDVPEGESVDRGWTVLEVMGPLDFSLSGVVAALVPPPPRSRRTPLPESTYGNKRPQIRTSHPRPDPPTKSSAASTRDERITLVR